MRINWASQIFHRRDGYGRYAMYLIKAMVQMGIEVHPVTLEMLDTPGWFRRIAGLDAGPITIQCGLPDSFRAVPGRNWGLTMYEDQTKIPAEWSAHINAVCERLIVPCEQNARLFKANGVRVPIHVIHGGTEPGEFPILPYVQRPTYTFLALGDRGQRKGVEQVYAAFYRAFPCAEYPDVRLVIKTRAKNGLFGGAVLEFEDRRVSVWREDTDSMLEVFGMVDCFVFPSLGEGWGMPPREAVMAGVPAIVSRNTGLEVGIDCWATRIVETQYGQTSILKGNGTWLVSDVAEVEAHMDWCYRNRAEARKRAVEGSKWLRSNQTWAHSAQKLVDLIQELS